MGVRTGVGTPERAEAPAERTVRWLPARMQTARWLRGLALASVISNVVIVVTGGAVRLTNSGLGCPTWPRCVGDSLVPRSKLGINGVIEFTNRTLTFVIGVTLLATAVVAWRQRNQLRLAVLALLGIPAQAVLGGIVVLTDLNPWLVAAHFLLSAAIIAVTFVLWWRVSEQRAEAVAPPVRWLTAGVATASLLVLVAGTIVTGAGPHAGDLKHGTIHRIDLPINGLAQLHADLVMVLIGLTVGAVAAGYALRSAALRRAALVLLGIELAQGAIGYTQYFLHVPPVLVGLHMLGACLVWIAALWVVLAVRVSPG